MNMKSLYLIYHPFSSPFNKLGATNLIDNLTLSLFLHPISSLFHFPLDPTDVSVALRTSTCQAID